jgi:hypothetical protein
MLFRADVRLEVALAPPAFPPGWPYEGLDARAALPPLLRPGTLASWEAQERIEEHAVARFADEATPSARVLEELTQQAEILRAWTLRDGPFDAFVRSVLGRAADAPERAQGLAEALAGWERVARAVPRTSPAPESPRAAVGGFGLRRAEAALAESWHGLRRPVGRWLAARSFASWLALQGEGVRSSALGLRLADAVLRAEAAREAATTRAALDDARLREAVRRADLLLLHLVDPLALARDLSRCEAARGAW